MCTDGGSDNRELLGTLRGALETLRAGGRVPLGGAVSDTELTQAVQLLEAVVRVAQARQAAVVRELEQRQAARGQAAGSTADLLTRTLRLTPGEARVRSEFADGLALLPETQAALADGRIGESQAKVAIRKAAEVKDREDGELLVKQIDATASSAGQIMDRNRLAREIDSELARSDMDVLAERERTAFARRSVSWTVRDGMHVLHAELDAVAGTRVRAMLDSLSDKTDERDTRTYSQRQADALVHMATLAEERRGNPHGTLQAVRPAGPLSGGAALRLSQGTRLPRFRSVGTLRSPSSGNRRAGPATVPAALVASVRARSRRPGARRGPCGLATPRPSPPRCAPRRATKATSAAWLRGGVHRPCATGPLLAVPHQHPSARVGGDTGRDRPLPSRTTRTTDQPAP